MSNDPSSPPEAMPGEEAIARAICCPNGCRRESPRAHELERDYMLALPCDADCNIESARAVLALFPRPAAPSGETTIKQRAELATEIGEEIYNTFLAYPLKLIRDQCFVAAARVAARFSRTLLPRCEARGETITDSQRATLTELSALLAKYPEPWETEKEPHDYEDGTTHFTHVRSRVTKRGETFALSIGEYLTPDSARLLILLKETAPWLIAGALSPSDGGGEK